MKVLFYTFTLVMMFFSTSCSLFFDPGYTEPASTVDCPPNQGNTLNNTISGKSTISEVNPDEIYLQLSRIKTNAIDNNIDEINIFLHPVDKNGNFITGLDKNLFWCEVIDSSYGEKTNIIDYDFEQVSTEEPLAIAIVMDHSGSMGETRVKIVQEQVYSFLKNKINPKDEIYLIKYDNNVELLSYPVHHALNDFRPGFVNGFSYFGGGTAFYDAVGKGIESLGNSKLNKKFVIALTDGLENSSKRYKSAEKLVKLANKSNISITTIGFGDNIDKPMLADTVSLGTGGIYHQICRSEDFNLVFNDIYHRYRDYYLLKYRTNRTIGTHSISVKLCLPEKKYETSNNYFISLDSDSVFVINDIFFEYNSDKLKNLESKKAINMINMMMKTYPDMEIDIYGHTDSIGSAQYNMDLSERRAKSVYEELKSKGHSIAKMGYRGFGESVPIADNGTPEGRQQNRRVEFKIRKFNPRNIVKNNKPVYKSPSETNRN